MIEFAVPHTLAFTFFPHWLMDLRQNFGAVKTRLTASNVHDAVLRLTEGGCDLLIAYHHPSQPLPLSADRYEMLDVSSESLAPYAKAGPDGQPLFALPGRPGERVPYLGYAAGAYMGRLVDVILKQAGGPLQLDPIYETTWPKASRPWRWKATGWPSCPTVLCARSSGPAGLYRPRLLHGQLSLTMEVRIYRERPGIGVPRQAGRTGAVGLPRDPGKTLDPDAGARHGGRLNRHGAGPRRADRVRAQRRPAHGPGPGLA